ncbi:hypothetical protein QEN19_002205 [Hanseniaspora menglaensis]
MSHPPVNKYNVNYGEGGSFGRPSNKVKISFIPIYQTEEQIKQLVNSIQPIKNIQLLFDHETGKSRGICLITFSDINGAESCIRNLHKMPMGKRYLKCEYYQENENRDFGLIQDAGIDSFDKGQHSESNLTFTMQGNVVNKENIGMALDLNMIESPFKFINSYIESSQLSDKKNQFFLLELLKQESNNVNGLTLNLLQQFPQLNFLLMELLIRNNILSVEELKQRISLLKENDGSDNLQKLTKNNKLEQLLTEAKVNDLVDSKITAQDTEESDIQDKIDKRKVKLLKRLLKLSRDEIELLPKQEKFEIYELQQRAARGDFN